MVLYLTTIAIAIILITILNIIVLTLPLFSFASLEILGITVLTVAIEFIISAIIALIIHWLPKSWFLAERKIFKVYRWERKFYEKLGIKQWKDKVWELGGLGGFRKNKINDPTNPEYFERFIMESNKGLVTHIISVFAVFLCIPFFPQFAWTIGFPASMVGLVLHTLPSLILRYNIPKLTVARERARRNKVREEKEKINIEKD